jgi:hypothetical protein
VVSPRSSAAKMSAPVSGLLLMSTIDITWTYTTSNEFYVRINVRFYVHSPSSRLPHPLPANDQFFKHLGKLSRKSDTALAVRYALGRWEALLRYLDDGGIEIDNNAAYAASGIGGVMPRAGLCRVEAVWMPHTACSSLAMRHK